MKKICNERQNLIYSNDYGFLASELDNNCYLEYFNSLALKCGKSTSNQQKWLVVLKYLKEYSEEIKMKDLTIHFVHGFKDFLLNKAHFRKKGEKISQNSASSYFSKVIYSLKCAYKEGLLRDNLAPKIDRVKAVEVKKAFELEGSDVVIAKHLAIIYKEMKKYEKAKRYFVEALKNCKLESERQDVMEALQGLKDLRLPASSSAPAP